MSLLDDQEHAIHVPANGGLARTFSTDVYVTKLSAEQTGGRLGLVHASIPPGQGPPPHIHAHSDELFYVLQGELEFQDGDRTLIGRAGDAVYLPRGTVHRFKNIGIQSATMLFIYTPAGVEGGFVAAGGELTPDVPVAPWDPEQFIAAVEIMRHHDFEFVKPQDNPRPPG